MRAPIRDWQDLDVWQRAHHLALQVYRIVEGFPALERYRLADQLCRAAVSIPANIAEGKGRGSLREYLKFLTIARGSIEEVRYLLLLAGDLGYVAESVYTEIAHEYRIVGKMLNALMKALRARLPT